MEHEEIANYVELLGFAKYFAGSFECRNTDYYECNQLATCRRIAGDTRLHLSRRERTRSDATLLRMVMTLIILDDNARMVVRRCSRSRRMTLLRPETM